MHSIGVRVIGMEPYPNLEWIKKNNVELMELEDLIEKSDIITLHVPSEETKGIIGERQISKMKNNVIIINTSRGGLY